MATEVANPVAGAVLETPVARRIAPRLDSVDLLRGLIMIIMALDHVRDYFTGYRLAPEDLARTWPALFFTRWFTHFCAPWFCFLAGTGAFLAMTRGRSLNTLRTMLVKRGA